MKHYTDNKLMELLKHPDKTVQRHAKGIETRLHALEMEQLDYKGGMGKARCSICSKIINQDIYNEYESKCLSCFCFYNK